MVQHCAGPLSDATSRSAFADRTGLDAGELAQTAVTDPAATVRADVTRLLDAPLTSPGITVSGHVDDLETGLLGDIVAPASPRGAHPTAPAAGVVVSA